MENQKGNQKKDKKEEDKKEEDKKDENKVDNSKDKVSSLANVNSQASDQPNDKPNDESKKLKDNQIKNEDKNKSNSTTKEEKKDETTTSSNLKKPWLSYAMAVCRGLQSQLNNTDETLSLLESTSTSDNNTIKQLRENQREIMNKVLKELNNLTQRARSIDQQTCIKPNKIKQLNDKADNKINSTNNECAISLNQTQSTELAQQIENQSTTAQSTSQNLNAELLSNIINNEFKCSICQELIVTATNLKCSHTFCKVCIDEWLERNKKCPVCRTFISTKSNHVLPIDNFLALYFSNFTSTEQQEDRTRLLNERRSREVIVIEDSPANQQFASQQLLPLADLDIMEIFELEGEIWRDRPQGRRRRRLANNRSSRNRLANQRSSISAIDRRLENSGSSDLNSARRSNRRIRGNRLNLNQTQAQQTTPNRRPTPMVQTPRLTSNNRSLNCNRTTVNRSPTNRLTQYTQTDLSSLDVSPPSEFRNNVDENSLFPILAFEIDMIDNFNLNEDDDQSNESTTNLRTNSRDEARNEFRMPVLRRRRSPNGLINRSLNRPIRPRNDNLSNESTSRRRRRSSNINSNQISSAVRRRASTDRSSRLIRRLSRSNGIESRREERRRERRLRRLRDNDYLLDREHC